MTTYAQCHPIGIDATWFLTQVGVKATYAEHAPSADGLRGGRDLRRRAPSKAQPLREIANRTRHKSFVFVGDESGLAFASWRKRLR